MITIFQALTQYCIEKELPPPGKQDLLNCGRLASHHFKNFWANNRPDEVVPDTAFVKSYEPDGVFIVPAYPDIFLQEMFSRFKVYYLKKSSQITTPTPVKTPPPKRKRIPSKAVKEISVKPSQINE